MGTTQRITMMLAFCATVLAGVEVWAKPGPVPDVPPVISGNVRYEAPHFMTPCDSKQNGGCVVAYDNTSNTQLWAVKVYCTKYDVDLEQDVQDVLITSLTLSTSNQLQVTNQAGKRFTIDPTTQKVTGDATGCGSSSGCSYTPGRSEMPMALVLSGIGLAALLGVRRLRAVRS